MTSLAISLHFAALHKGEALVAGILISGALAQVFIVPLLAPVFDRYDARVVAPAVGLLELVTLAVLAAVPHTAVLIAGNVVLSCLSGLSIPAIFVIADSCVPESQQARVFSLLDTARLSGGFAGPIIGGALLSWSTLRMALLIECFAVALSVSIVLYVVLAVLPKVPSQQLDSEGDDAKSGDASAAAGGTGSFWRSLLQAPMLLAASSQARQALLAIWAAIVFTSIFNVALVFFITQSLQASGLMYAIVAQAFIVGRILGARLGGRVRRENALAVVVGAGTVMGLCIALPGLVPSLALSLVCFAAGGVCNAVQVAALRLVVVNAVAPEIKPKALSTMGSVNNSAMLVGYVIAAPVVATAGPTAALVISGLGTAVLTLLPTALGAGRRALKAAGM